MTEKVATAPNPLTSPWILLAIVGCLVVDANLIDMLVHHRAATATVLSLHFLTTLLLIVLALPKLNDRPFSGWLLFLAVLQGGFGPLGTGGFAVTALIRRHLLKNQSQLSELLRMLFVTTDTTVGGRVYQHIEVNQDLLNRNIDLIPFRDQVRLGDEQQKRMVLTHIGSHYAPQFSPVLRDCLRDTNPSIRVHAATIMNKVSHHYQQHLIEARSNHTDNATDETLLQLAHAYDEYSHSGTVDNQQERRFRQQAITHYKRYLEDHPDDDATTRLTIRLLIRDDQIDEAYELLEKLSASACDNQATEQMVMWQMEVYYRLRRFEQLREVAARFNDHDDALETLPFRVRDAVRLWMTPTDTVGALP